MKPPCEQCGLREATETWAPAGTFGWVHGISSRWCLLCCLTAQVAHAREMAESLPKLEADFAAEAAKPAQYTIGRPHVFSELRSYNLEIEGVPTLVRPASKGIAVDRDGKKSEYISPPMNIGWRLQRVYWDEEINTWMYDFHRLPDEHRLFTHEEAIKNVREAPWAKSPKK